MKTLIILLLLSGTVWAVPTECNDVKYDGNSYNIYLICRKADRQSNALESIAESLKMLAEKP